MIVKITAPSPYPFTSHNLRFEDFSLPTDMDRKASIQKPEIPFASDAIPPLPEAYPSKNFVGEGAKLHDPMSCSCVTLDHLTRPSPKSYSGLRIPDLRYER